MDWKSMIEAARAENVNGIEMRRGKKYTTVAIRVEMMRRHAGALGISTEIVHWGTAKGESIVVKATVTDEVGRVLATGHAEEIRGQGQVNSTSALENAETSAIGRALAAFGLSGGEFASANEMDGAVRKAKAQAEVSAAAVAEAIAAANRCADIGALGAWWRALNDSARDVAAHVDVIAAKDARKSKLTQKDAA